MRVLREGLTSLADPAYAAEQERVAPGSGAIFGVRNPLTAAVARQLRQPLRESSSSSALWLAERLVAEQERELVLFSHVALRRSLPDDPERSWQLMRRLARSANNWISVDSLAELYAAGILLERFRWAELEQLVYSADRWERRLVGATIARLPYELPKRDRPRLKTSDGLTLIKSLLGDAEPDVQKSLSWALRSWNEVDPGGVAELLRSEASLASQANDGNKSLGAARRADVARHRPAARQGDPRAPRGRPPAPEPAVDEHGRGGYRGVRRHRADGRPGSGDAGRPPAHGSAAAGTIGGIGG